MLPSVSSSTLEPEERLILGKQNNQLNTPPAGPHSLPTDIPPSPESQLFSSQMHAAITQGTHEPRPSQAGSAPQIPEALSQNTWVSEAHEIPLPPYPVATSSAKEGHEPSPCELFDLEAQSSVPSSSSSSLFSLSSSSTSPGLANQTIETSGREHSLPASEGSDIIKSEPELLRSPSPVHRPSSVRHALMKIKMPSRPRPIIQTLRVTGTHSGFALRSWLVFIIKLLFKAVISILMALIVISPILMIGGIVVGVYFGAKSSSPAQDSMHPAIPTGPWTGRSGGWI
ncbi:hypothetical protein NP233_g2930 [Leucocoprinus birnbaumii]|uniref:Uncharacterized protein n=1 Tax=Leucocoprinus birnbaumii TaxID=56174 RepID=A0AAD5VXZ7_9AGAR|nr:hypothetical protein NP233_g2930 [Leucocoprinus birnbaumii]